MKKVSMLLFLFFLSAPAFSSIEESVDVNEAYAIHELNQAGYEKLNRAEEFDIIVEANGENHLILMEGRDGEDGDESPLDCGPLRDYGMDGFQGENGKDAGILLIKYTDEQDLQKITISSRQGLGGKGGTGCPGRIENGKYGRDGINGSHVIIYLLKVES